MRRRHLWEGWVRPDSCSHFDSKCWVSLSSFTFDLIFGFSFNSCSLDNIVVALLHAKNFFCPALALSLLSLFDYWRDFSSTTAFFCLSVCLFVSLSLAVFSLPIVRLVLCCDMPLFSPFTPSSPLLLTCSLTSCSETVQIKSRELGCGLTFTALMSH